MTGEVAILNVGMGDTKLTFDNKNLAETIRAARIVKDMLRRGYALLVEVDQPDGGKAFQRAIDFDETKNEYIIADFDPSYATPTPVRASPTYVPPPRYGVEPPPQPETVDEEAGEAQPDRAATGGAKTQPSPQPRASRGRRRLPASGTRAVAVARSAGG